MSLSNRDAVLKIGWAEVDITPEELPVYISGQFHARVSEGVQDPLLATALVLESAGQHVVFVSVDTVGISEMLRDAVRGQLNEEGLDPGKVILHATHTHEAPFNVITPSGAYQWGGEDVDFGLDVVPAAEYVRFASERIAGAVAQAWQTRAPGGVAYGQDYAVIGRNRRWFNRDGIATMYGLSESVAGSFAHIEGYEDHSLNLLATYDEAGKLTGIIVNVPCPSQEDEGSYELSADFWHEARQELRARFGPELFILPQCSAAGELTSHLIFEKSPHERMLRLRNRTARQEVAVRIADAVERILPYLPSAIERRPLLEHRHETLQLPMNTLTEADAEEARRDARQWKEQYEAERQTIESDPQSRDHAHWYGPFTRAFNRYAYYQGVVERFERQQTQPAYPAEIHIVRLGEIAFASNPFEYYLDFGIQIKVKSPALQTFIVQLAGRGTYVPSHRAAEGGGYGAVPASNPVGPEGGQVLADETVRLIRSLWAQENALQ